MFSDFYLALWNVCVVMILILYVYLFIKSLYGITILQNIQENRRSGLHLDIEKVVAEEYQKAFAYSYKKHNNYFLKKLLKELHHLGRDENREMIMHVLDSVANIVGTKLKWRPLLKVLDQHSNKYNRMPVYLYRTFTELFQKIEEDNIELSLDDLLKIYTQTHNIIYIILIDSNDKKNRLILTEIINLYSTHNNWLYTPNNKECTYFQLPLAIKNRISSYEDIENIHKNIKNTKGYNYILEINKYSLSKLADKEKSFVESYTNYIYTLLEYYKDYLDELHKDNYSEFWRVFDSHTRREITDQEEDYIEYISSTIYNYILRLECDENNKKFILVLLRKLSYKYRVAFIFHHMLYPGPFWKWKNEVLYFRQIIERSWDDDRITDYHVVEFVCNKIKDSDIGYRIEPELINWIAQNVRIDKLTEQILNRCLTDNYIPYAKFLKIMFIFSEGNYYLFDFYRSDLNHVEYRHGWDWKIDVIHELLQTPQLLEESFFSQHVFAFCKQVSYSLDHFITENDFRVFLIHPTFKLSEGQFDDLINNGARKGIIEFLVLKLNKSEYYYLHKGNRANHFLARVEEIIDQENKSIEDYVRNLVARARSIGANISAISVTRQDSLIKCLHKLFDSQVNSV
ncbi:hypothetical protein [Paenibacillus sp. CR_12]|uniref:hypothetical protein n=1 Tax=Paenibacillus sp. CR_12 TaxID=3055793 RepID=UPI0035C141FE